MRKKEIIESVGDSKVTTYFEAKTLDTKEWIQLAWSWKKQNNDKEKTLLQVIDSYALEWVYSKETTAPLDTFIIMAMLLVKGAGRVTGFLFSSKWVSGKCQRSLWNKLSLEATVEYYFASG